MNQFLVVSLLACAGAKQSSRHERNALPQEIYRENVEPAKGGKVPESAHLRAELNMIDTAGLRDPEGIEMEKMMAAMSPELPDHMLQDTMSKYHPGLTPALRLKPNYAPHTLTHSLPPASPISPFSPAPVGFAPAPVPYTPVPVHPGPVLLEKKPYETKTVQALPVTVAETYTNFDCRGKYANRHYADPEAGCQIYHFCHEDGKQDTFHCSYGTAFNEYLGTCDHETSVTCHTGEGYAGPESYHPAPAPYHPAPAPYHPTPAPAPYHPAPTPYVHPAPAPAPYVHTAPAPAPYVAPAPAPFVAHPAPAPYVHPAPAPAPYVASAAPAPAPYPAPAPIKPFVAAAPTPYAPAAPAPYAPAPAPYSAPVHIAPAAPAPYHEPLVYEQASYTEPIAPGTGIKPFTQF